MSFKSQLVDLAATVQACRCVKANKVDEDEVSNLLDFYSATVRDMMLPTIKLAIAKDEWYRFDTGAVIKVPIRPADNKLTTEKARLHAEVFKKVIQQLQQDMLDILPNCTFNLDCESFMAEPDGYNMRVTFTFPVPDGCTKTVFTLAKSTTTA